MSLFREYSHFKRDSGAKNPSVPTRISVTTVSNEEDEAHARLEAVDRSSMKPKSISFVCGDCPIDDEKVIKLQSLISLRRERSIQGKDQEGRGATTDGEILSCELWRRRSQLIERYLRGASLRVASWSRGESVCHHHSASPSL